MMSCLEKELDRITRFARLLVMSILALLQLGGGVFKCSALPADDKGVFINT